MDGALLFLPLQHVNLVDQRPDLTANYARKYVEKWYQHVNGNEMRGVANGALYFITGCQKTREWHTAAAWSVETERSVSLAFDPTMKIGLGTTGSLKYSSASVDGLDGPLEVDEGGTQCTVVEGWKLYLCDAWRPLAKVTVPVDMAQDSKPYTWVPCRSSRTTAPAAGFGTGVLASSKQLPTSKPASDADYSPVDPSV